jgi:hypothetical protein
MCNSHTKCVTIKYAKYWASLRNVLRCGIRQGRLWIFRSEGVFKEDVTLLEMRANVTQRIEQREGHCLKPIKLLGSELAW